MKKRFKLTDLDCANCAAKSRTASSTFEHLLGPLGPAL